MPMHATRTCRMMSTSTDALQRRQHHQQQQPSQSQEVVYRGQIVRVQVPQYYYSVCDDDFKVLLERLAAGDQRRDGAAADARSSTQSRRPCCNRHPPPGGPPPARCCRSWQQKTPLTVVVDDPRVQQQSSCSANLGVACDAGAGCCALSGRLTRCRSEPDLLATDGGATASGSWRSTSTTLEADTDYWSWTPPSDQNDVTPTVGRLLAPPLSSAIHEGVPRTVVLKKSGGTFGFVLCGAKSSYENASGMAFTPTANCPALQYLDSVEHGSVAEKAGLTPGDFLLEINGQNVVRASHLQTVRMIKQAGDAVYLKVVTSSSSSSTGRGCRPQPAGTESGPTPRPATAPPPPTRSTSCLCCAAGQQTADNVDQNDEDDDEEVRDDEICRRSQPEVMTVPAVSSENGRLTTTTLDSSGGSSSGTTSVASLRQLMQPSVATIAAQVAAAAAAGMQRRRHQQQHHSRPDFGLSSKNGVADDTAAAAAAIVDIVDGGDDDDGRRSMPTWEQRRVVSLTGRSLPDIVVTSPPRHDSTAEPTGSTSRGFTDAIYKQHQQQQQPWKETDSSSACHIDQPRRLPMTTVAETQRDSPATKSTPRVMATTETTGRRSTSMTRRLEECGVPTSTTSGAEVSKTAGSIDENRHTLMTQPSRTTPTSSPKSYRSIVSSTTAAYDVVDVSASAARMAVSSPVARSNGGIDDEVSSSVNRNGHQPHARRVAPPPPPPTRGVSLVTSSSSSTAQRTTGSADKPSLSSLAVKAAAGSNGGVQTTKTQINPTSTAQYSRLNGTRGIDRDESSTSVAAGSSGTGKQQQLQLQQQQQQQKKRKAPSPPPSSSSAPSASAPAVASFTSGNAKQPTATTSSCTRIATKAELQHVRDNVVGYSSNGAISGSSGAGNPAASRCRRPAPGAPSSKSSSSSLSMSGVAKSNTASSCSAPPTANGSGSAAAAVGVGDCSFLLPATTTTSASGGNDVVDFITLAERARQDYVRRKAAAARIALAAAQEIRRADAAAAAAAASKHDDVIVTTDSISSAVAAAAERQTGSCSAPSHTKLTSSVGQPDVSSPRPAADGNGGSTGIGAKKSNAKIIRGKVVVARSKRPTVSHQDRLNSTTSGGREMTTEMTSSFPTMLRLSPPPGFDD